MQCQCMHFKDPLTAWCCKKTRSCTTAWVPFSCLVAAAIAPTWTTSGWHLNYLCSWRLSLQNCLYRIVTQTFCSEALLCWQIHCTCTCIVHNTEGPSWKEGTSISKKIHLSTLGHRYHDVCYAWELECLCMSLLLSILLENSRKSMILDTEFFHFGQ